MTSEEAIESRKKWAVLIGIDKYTYDDSLIKRRRVTRSGAQMGDPKDLKGSVNDVLAMRHYLTTTMNMEAEHIKLLLAPIEGREYKFELPPASEYEKPTYENIVKTLAEVPGYAKEHDLVFIHYSGHAGQATTVFADIKHKSGDGIDHSLMPTDIACTGRYLRDVELGALLQDIVAVGTVLTVVLDCCHSGGAIRGDDDDDDDLDNVRGEEKVYQSDPVVDRQLAHAAETSVKRWGYFPGWMESPTGFVVLAACLDYQKAKEMSEFLKCGDDLPPRYQEFWHGRLTYWLLDTLRTVAPGLSSAAIHQRLCAKIQTAVPDQTPYLVGEVDRFFFGPAYRSQVFAVPVLSIQPGGKELKLACGAFHGVREKAEYAIVPLSFELDRRIRPEDVLARVRVKEVLSGSSTATILRDTVKSGFSRDTACQAVLQSLPLEAQAAVRFIEAEEGQWEYFEAVWTLCTKNRKLLRLLGKDENSDEALLTVTVEDGCFQVKDRPGTLTSAVAALLRDLPWDAGDSMPWLVRRLEHLARYHMLRGLDNPGSREVGVQDLVDVEVTPAPKDAKRGSKVYPKVKSMELRNGVYEVPEEGLFRITVTNRGEKPVGCTFLCFDSLLGIEIIHPFGSNYQIIPGTQGQEFSNAENQTTNKLVEDFWVEIPDVLKDAEAVGSRTKEGLAAEATTTAELFKVLVSRPERDVTPLRLATLQEVEEQDYGHRGDSSNDEDTSLGTLDDLLDELMPVSRGHSLSSLDAAVAVDWQVKDIYVRAIPKS